MKSKRRKSRHILVGIRNIVIAPWKYYLREFFGPSYKTKIADYIARELPSRGRVLDFGCDEGFVGKYIADKNPVLEIEGIDVQEIRRPMILRQIYNGKQMPYKNSYFEAVYAVDVLHHTTDIVSKLEEIARVARKKVIIKDHRTFGPFSYLLVCFTDWVSNWPFGIDLAYNYPRHQEWLEIFEKSRLRLVKEIKPLKLGFLINEKYNPIYVLEKY